MMSAIAPAIQRDGRLVGNDMPRNVGGLDTRLDDMQLSLVMRRALAKPGVSLHTVADLLNIGAFEFSMMDGVGLVVFQQAADFLVRCGLSWSPDARLGPRRTRMLWAGARKRSA
jgi:hypothetical protein